MDSASQALAERLRDHLAPLPGLTEQKMFGGCAFMLDGNMVVATLKDGGLLARVGKEGYAEALTLPGCRPMTMGGKTMSGFVMVDADILEEDDKFADWLGRCVAFTASLPPK